MYIFYYLLLYNPSNIIVGFCLRTNVTGREPNYGRDKMGWQVVRVQYVRGGAVCCRVVSLFQ